LILYRGLVKIINFSFIGCRPRIHSTPQKIALFIPDEPPNFKFCYVQTSKVLFIRMGREEREEVWEDANSNRCSQVYAQRRVLRVERTFMALEQGSTSRRDAITPFSRAVRSSVLIRVKEVNPYNSGLDHVRSLSV